DDVFGPRTRLLDQRHKKAGMEIKWQPGLVADVARFFDDLGTETREASLIPMSFESPDDIGLFARELDILLYIDGVRVKVMRVGRRAHEPGSHYARHAQEVRLRLWHDVLLIAAQRQRAGVAHRYRCRRAGMNAELVRVQRMACDEFEI